MTMRVLGENVVAWRMEFPPTPYGPRAALVDPVWFLAAMFFIRTVNLPGLGFVGNALLNSLVTLTVATWRLRGSSWRALGLRVPASLPRSGLIVVLMLGSVIAAVVIIEGVLGESSSPASGQDAGTDSPFSWIAGNLTGLLLVLPVVWIESFLEELQDRAFHLTRLECLFSRIPLAVVLAVVGQAVVFGLRHSPGGGSRSFVTGAIGLILGIGYVASGRDLWSPIVAHMILNTLSMVERFTAAP